MCDIKPGLDKLHSDTGDAKVCYTTPYQSLIAVCIKYIIYEVSARVVRVQQD